MASFMYALWSIASVHCSVRPEISPCTCEPIFTTNRVELSCEKVDSFNQIVDALSGKFSSNLSISLQISHSQLDDLEMRSFTEMKLNMIKLRMISDNLRSVPELPFRGLSNLEYLSFAENDLDEIPKHVLNHLPKISTLDLGKGRIKAVMQDDFKGIPKVRYLILVSNNITRLDKGAFPKGLSSLHLGRNQITTLNGTLRDLHDLESLFINVNNIKSLDGELPASQNLKLILAQNNSLERLPQSMKEMPSLDSLLFQNNKIKSLDGVLRNAKKLKELKAFYNQIEYLAEDEFLEADYLELLDLAYNNIKSLNNSLLPIRGLRLANFSFNEMEEFSMNEIRGLEHLKSLDISYNKIRKLTGRQKNLIDQQSFLVDLHLHHNRLKSLDGALMGLNKLRILSLTHNQIERILPDDFIGLESLEILDLSYNQLLTLEETSTTVLPSLKIIKVAHNNLTKLEKDFHGLPVLCQANLMYNQITSVSADLVSKTKCSNHGVPGNLEIWLENNPIMCDNERVNELCPIMASQEAHIRGKSQCYENDREVCTNQLLILRASLTDNIPLIVQQQLNQKVSNNKPLVQVYVPAPHLYSKPPIIAPIAALNIKPLQIPTPITTTTSAPPTKPPTTPSTTTTTTESTASTSTEAISTTTAKSSTTSTTSTTSTASTPSTTLATTTTALSSSDLQPAFPSDTTAMKIFVDAPLLHTMDIQTDYPTVEYIPLPENDSGQTNFSDGEDNSVHEEYSPIVISDLENSQRLLMQEEPPETP